MNGVLDMFGHIDSTFQSHTVEQIKIGTAIVDFRSVFDELARESFAATVQPVSLKEIEFLGIGGERINDVRRVYRNDGGMFYEGNDDQMLDVLYFSEAPGRVPATYWKVIQADNRPWRNYAKAIADKLDPEMIAKYGLAV